MKNQAWSMLIKPKPQSAPGFTLIEVLITVVVLAIAATTIMNVFISTVRSSADPLLQQQAVAIASAYMEEIQSQLFADPLVPESGGPEVGETRATFNDVQDYNGLSDSGAKDQSGAAITQLSDYKVTVTVTGHALTAGASSIVASDAMRIDVTVTHPAIDAITLSGYRTNY
jgi:MSHA pilin protein MshD